MPVTSAPPNNTFDKSTPPKKNRKIIFILFILFFTFIFPIIPATLFLIMYMFIARPFHVNGNAMSPTYTNGQQLLSLLINAQSPARNDVIVFRSPIDPNKDFIKRVIGVPGDSITLVDNSISVNGTKEAGDNATFGGAFLTDDETVTVPQNQYFVLGDNRAESADSREYGFIPKENIIGRVLFCYFKCNQKSPPQPDTLQFSITLPKHYVQQESSTAYSVIYTTPIMNPEKVVQVHTEPTQLPDPCQQIPLGYPNAKCTTINGYQALDLGAEIPPTASTEREYRYLFIHEGRLYQLVFRNVMEEEKNSMLKTFKLTN